MAFQTGTKVDPRLMQADYSGFANAASIQANAMDKLGSKIGSIIEDYKEKKQDKIEKDNFAAALMPYATKMSGGDAAEAQKLVNLFANKPKNAAVLLNFIQMGQEQDRATREKETLEALGAGGISAQEAFARGVSPEAIKDYTSATEGLDAKKFSEAVTLAAEAVGGTYDPAQKAIVVDESMIPFYGKKSIPLSDPMFESYFATAKGQTMLGRGFDVLGTNNSAQVTQGQGATSAPVSASESGSSPTLMSDIGGAISSIAQTPGNVDPTDPTINTGLPMEFLEPSLDISEVAGGAVSRMSDFFKRKLKENEAVRQSTYGR
tara:strand:+ start:112 stop:1071 length:960 start_codon:yes stop_codon:yes gene_type:complete